MKFNCTVNPLTLTLKRETHGASYDGSVQAAKGTREMKLFLAVCFTLSGM